MAIRFHREGRILIPISFIIIVLICGAAYFLLKGTQVAFLSYPVIAAGIIIMFLILNFFRNPPLEINEDADMILAPCDGKVVVIEEVQDEVYFKDKVLQVSIFMSPLNVHVNRNPISGAVKFFRYFPGKYLVAFNPKSSTLNEQTYVVAENDRVTVGYKQIAGFVARRIKWYIDENDTLSQGAEFGFIKFGSRVDLLLPLSCEVKVHLGDKTKGGQTVIARIGSGK